MNRGLVVLDATASSERLLREAAAIVAGSGGELVVLSVLSPENHEHDVETRSRIARAEHASGTDYTVEGLARDCGEQLADEVLSGFDVTYEVVGLQATDGLAWRILGAATERDCDHVFVLGKRRSRFGALFDRDPVKEVLRELAAPSPWVGTDPERQYVRLREPSSPLQLEPTDV